MVVIGDDDIHLSTFGVVYLGHVGTGTVGGDDERGASCLQLVKCVEVEATAFVQAAGDVEIESGLRMLEGAQGAKEEG